MKHPVMAGLVPAIHVFLPLAVKNVDARDKPGHDDVDTLCPPYKSSAL
jgi:hypothetical protein